MNQDRLHGLWKQFGGKMKEHWGMITNDSLTTAAGTRSRLAGGLQEQRGILKQEADRQLEEFMSRHRNWQDLSQ